MKVPLKELPGHWSFDLDVAYVDALIADLPMRAALGADLEEIFMSATRGRLQ